MKQNLGCNYQVQNQYLGLFTGVEVDDNPDLQ